MAMKEPDNAHTAVLLSTDCPAHAPAPAGLSGLTVMTTRSWHCPSTQAQPSPIPPLPDAASHSLLLSWLPHRFGAFGRFWFLSFLDRR